MRAEKKLLLYRKLTAAAEAAIQMSGSRSASSAAPPKTQCHGERF